MNSGMIYLVVGMLCLWSLDISPGQSPTPAEIKQVQARLKTAGLRSGTPGWQLGSPDRGGAEDLSAAARVTRVRQLSDATRQALLSTGGAPEAVQEAQTPRAVPPERPEQQRSAHDRSNRFQAMQA
jgi:hypothetical protein